LTQATTTRLLSSSSTQKANWLGRKTHTTQQTLFLRDDHRKNIRVGTFHDSRFNVIQRYETKAIAMD
jgi:hypothetical protein